MSDTLTNIKQRLNIDQRNLASGVILSSSNSTAKVRLRDGTSRTAYLPAGITVSSGDLVQISIDGNQASVQGGATLQPLAGEKVIWI